MTEGLDSSLASMAAVPIANDETGLLTAEAPPLAWMAGLAALGDLVLNRVLVQLGHEMWSRDALRGLDTWGAFARNLSVVSALVALGFCLVGLSSRRSRLPISARAGIASFGWVLVSIVTMMTLLPRAYTRPELVLVVAGIAHALMLLLVLAGIHWRSNRATTGALLLTLAAVMSGVAAMIVTVVGRRTFWEHTERLSNAFRWSGELAYLAIPLAVGATLAIPWKETRGRVTLAFSALVAGAVTAGLLVWKQVAGRELPTLFYGATRLEFLPDESTVLYAIPLGVGWAVTAAAALSKDPARRQLGAALLLLLSAGYAPRSPSTLVITVLGVALLARVGITFAKRRQQR